MKPGAIATAAAAAVAVIAVAVTAAVLLTPWVLLAWPLLSAIAVAVAVIESHRGGDPYEPDPPTDPDLTIERTS